MSASPLRVSPTSAANLVLVNMLDADDARAIELGQYVASDTESGGVERIKPQNAVQKMGEDMGTFAGRLLRSTDDEQSFAELVDENGVNVLKWMQLKGYITPTQYKSAFDTRGNLTAEAKNDLKGIMYHSIFQGGSTQLEEMFNRLPAKAQKAILATAYRDYNSPESERAIREIQNSIMAYDALSAEGSFKDAKNWEEVRYGVERWKGQYQIDFETGESYLPTDKFSNFALHLAAMYKVDKQKTIQDTFNEIYDLVQGLKEPGLFDGEDFDRSPRTLEQAIKETLNIDYDGKIRSNAVAVGNTQGAERRRGSSGETADGEQGESESQSAGSGRGTENVRGEVEGVSRLNWSEEKAKNGEPFLIGENGEINLVSIPQEVFAKMGISQMPFRLTPSMVNHVYLRHSKELKLRNTQEAVNVILDVMQNFDHVRKGNGNTFVFAVEDGKSRSARRAITLVLEYDNGEWLGVKTAGYDRVGNLQELPILWEKSENKSSTAAATSANVPSEQSSQGGQTDGIASNRNMGNSSAGKDTEKSDTEQEDSSNKAFDAAMNERGGIRSSKPVAKKKFNIFKYASKDELHPVLAGVYHDANGGYAVATDGYVLVADKDGYDSKQAGKVVDKKGNEISPKYVRWRDLFPSADSKKTMEVPFDVADLQSFVAGVREAVGKKENPLVSLRFPDGHISQHNLSEVESFANAAAHIGATTMRFYKISSFRNTVAEGKGGLAVIAGGQAHPRSFDVRNSYPYDFAAKRPQENAGKAADAPLTLEDMRSATQEEKGAESKESKAESVETPKADAPKTKKPKNPSGNKIVTDERYEELRKRMLEKLRGQMNMGVDPEILAIGVEMAVFHIEKGTRRFGEFAKALIKDLGDEVRPYLKAFYNGARDLPELSGMSKDMTPYDEVGKFDTLSFDKENGAGIVAKAKHIAKEQDAKKEAEEGKEKLVELRNDKRRKTESTKNKTGHL